MPTAQHGILSLLQALEVTWGVRAVMEASRVDMGVKEGSLRAKERVATITTMTMVKGVVVMVVSRVVDTSWCL